MGTRHKHPDMRSEMEGDWGGSRKATDSMSGSQGAFQEHEPGDKTPYVSRLQWFPSQDKSKVLEVT